MKEKSETVHCKWSYIGLAIRRNPRGHEYGAKLFFKRPREIKLIKFPCTVTKCSLLYSPLLHKMKNETRVSKKNLSDE